MDVIKVHNSVAQEHGFVAVGKFGAAPKGDLDPYTEDVTLIVTTTRLRKKGSPTKRDVYVPTDAIAYNPDTDAYENAMNLFRDARDEDPPYLWGIVSRPAPLLPSDHASK